VVSHALRHITCIRKGKIYMHGNTLQNDLSKSTGVLGSEKGLEECFRGNFGVLLFRGILLFQTLLLEKFMSAKGLGVWVKTEKDSFVDQGIFLLCPRALLDFLASRSDDRLNFIAVD